MEPSACCAHANDGNAMTPQDLHRRLALGHEIVLVDVRQPWGYQLVHLNGATLLPLPQLPWHLDVLDPTRPIVVYCHHGIRSFEAMALLRSVGFPDGKHLQGGIDRWSVEVDPSLPRY